MASVFTLDAMDFTAYERETEAQQKVRSARVWVQELIDRIESPVPQKCALLPWRKTHQQIQFRPGEVTVWFGANGGGKSLITGQVAASLCAQDEKVCIASFEMKPIKTLERMARQWSSFNPNDPAFVGSVVAKAALIDVYEQFRDWSDGRLFLYDQQGTVNAKQVAAVTRYAAKELGVTHMFIDSLMKCVAGEDDFNGQKLFVDEITAIARDYAIHVHLVHHVRKPPSEDHKPSKYDLKGSGSVSDQVDNVIAVWRNKPKERTAEAGKAGDAGEPDALLICDKQRNGEWEGAIGLWFDRASQQFVGAPGAEPIVLYRHPEDQ